MVPNIASAQHNPLRFRLILVTILALALALLIGLVFFGSAPEGTLTENTPDGKALRIASPPPGKIATVLSPYGPGFEQELAARFCRQYSCTPEWIAVNSKEEALEMLLWGEADLLAGFGDDPESSAAEHPELAGGPAYAPLRLIRVSGNEEAASASDAPLIFSPAMDLETNAEHEADLLLDPASYALLLPQLGRVQSYDLREEVIPHRWIWRGDDKNFAVKLASFWEDAELAPFLAELNERYFAFLPEETDPSEILDLREAVINRLPAYRQMILKAVRETGVPPLLLLAVMYRESRLRSDAVSATNVRGIMQLTTATAEMLGVDRLDPEQCIMGGARYLRSIWDSLEDGGIDPWDRWFMTLAAYNQGPGSLNGARRIAKNLGGSGDSWAELKNSYPRLRDSRGGEAVRYVESIRYYYYILHGFITFTPPEMEHLAALLSSRIGFPAIASN